jgi:restriction system protein
LPIPPYAELMLPVLRLSAEKTWDMRDLVARIADDLDLTEAEREQEIPSGRTKVIASRVHWAKTYLKQAGLIEQPKRAKVEITQRGRDVLDTHPTKIDAPLLLQFPEFQDFLSRTKSSSTQISPTDSEATVVLPTPPDVPPTTPEEQLEMASAALNEALRDALLARIMEASPASFERLIIDLLIKMGYGGSRTDAGEHLGKTGDGGVDGVIREDRLGLDRVYLQAKRYKPGNTVGGPTVHEFIGALFGQGAQKGVLITTSAFTPSARAAATHAGGPRIVLLDGQDLTKLMIQFDVGVRISRTVEIKRIDPDFFEDIETE